MNEIEFHFIFLKSIFFLYELFMFSACYVLSLFLTDVHIKEIKSSYLYEVQLF